MPKTRLEKQEILRDLKEKINKSKSIVFAKFGGLKVSESESLRKQLKEENSEFFVAKKTLINLGLKDAGIADVDTKNMEGRIAVVFGYQDEVAPAKIVQKFKKESENKIEFAGGILENKFISADKVGELAKIPSRIELYAKMVGSMNAPISGFVNVLAGNFRKLVYVLKAIEDTKK